MISHIFVVYLKGKCHLLFISMDQCKSLHRNIVISGHKLDCWTQLYDCSDWNWVIRDDFFLIPPIIYYIVTHLNKFKRFKGTLWILNYVEIVVINILIIYIFLPLDFRGAPHLIVPRAPRTLKPALPLPSPTNSSLPSPQCHFSNPPPNLPIPTTPSPSSHLHCSHPHSSSWENTENWTESFLFCRTQNRTEFKIWIQHSCNSHHINIIEHGYC